MAHTVEPGVKRTTDILDATTVNVDLRVRFTDLSTDPANLVNGDMWVTSGVLKIRLGGVTKTVTVT